jgi:hypothetical protein
MRAVILIHPTSLIALTSMIVPEGLMEFLEWCAGFIMILMGLRWLIFAVYESRLESRVAALEAGLDILRRKESERVTKSDKELILPPPRPEPSRKFNKL